MILQVLKNLNIEKLNDMQLATIDATSKKQDVILISPTGSGKTLAFLIPILQQLNPEVKGLQALIVVPARELALQIEQVFKKMSSPYKINCCYGGHSTKTERFNLQEMPSVLVGTPGRLCHHLNAKNITTENVKILVLDEFDKSLEFGFQEDLAYIINFVPKNRQCILTSATVLDELPDFITLKNAVKLNYSKSAEDIPNLDLKLVVTEKIEKLNTLIQLIRQLGSESMIIFCNHREAVDRMSEGFRDLGFIHEVFHGGMDQIERERALIKFKNGSCNILIATDLASRGIDIPEIDNIIHYQLPLTVDSFIHRNGRTARMKAKGKSYIMLTAEEKKPKFIPDNMPEIEVKPNTKKYPLPIWQTLYINVGKKEKINKIDIVGLLLQKGQLQKNELGLIEVLDHCAFIAVNREKANAVLKLMINQKLKNKSFKISISN